MAVKPDTAAKAPRMTKRASTARRDLVSRVGVAVRKMGAQSVVTSQVVADRFDLHTTDLEVLNLIFLREQASAGELAKATGLTSGSITALIDRLTKAGYVERHADPEDRRRVMVRIRHDAIEPIKAVYMPMQALMFALWSKFGPRELEVIADFLERSTELAVACAEEIRRTAQPKGAASGAAVAHRGRPSGGQREESVSDPKKSSRRGQRHVDSRGRRSSSR